MTLLVTADGLRARRAVATGALEPLAAGLRHELQPLLAGSLDVPREKALLSRAGGRCERDGALLAYDPFDPRHHCPQCGSEHAGELHDRFRLYWHQLWLAERAVHGALLGVLLDDVACRSLAVRLLDAWAARYLDYPNADNVLGPSRPFFSTYLEAIWLLQLCVALDLLELGAPSGALSALGSRVRERIIEPSSTLIASYDEGMSNRQVWNNAALLAAGSLLGDEATMDSAIHGPSGLLAHLDQALLPDGSWYEGENYHLFAHRGLWYGVRIAEAGGLVLRPALASRYRDGFAAPFRTLLPDLTFPSRRDSQYAVSVRQPRFAESCELGLARRDDERLTSMLARLYDSSLPHGDTGRASSSADVERNLPATGMTRSDLSWRTLLCALPELPPLHARPFESDLLPAQGIAILRRDGGRQYVALDYGHSGGGHGHPDRLNLILVDGAVRWFDDPGTGSYVDESLHWYRSTLAHTAPLVDGRSQQRVHGALVAFDDHGETAWVSAAAELTPGLLVRRSLVVVENYLIDCLEWESEAEHELALPLHGVDLVDDHGLPLAREAARISGGDAKEDGFGFLRDTQRVFARDGALVRLRASRDGIGNAGLDGWISAPAGTRWERALAPDVPSRPGLAPMMLLRAAGRHGRLLGVWSWRGAVVSTDISDTMVALRLADGRRDEHTFTTEGWRIERERPGRCDIVVLGGFADDSVRNTPLQARAAGTDVVVPAPASLPAM
ncbi:MAG: heparinase II/III family protein, partial [Gemmatimonadales bacterium]